MPQNLLVNVTTFGAYKAGDVIPAYEAGGHDLAFLVERGVVTPTDKPTTVEVAPKRATPTAPAEDVYLERDRLFRETARLEQENKELDGQLAEVRRQRDDVRAEIGKYVEDNAHLTRACEEHQSTIDRLEKELAETKALLEDVTAPAPPAPAAG